MPIRHQITDFDTVEYLSHTYYGTPERWREIVEYNNLVYPYVSKNPEDRYKVYASGFVKVTRSLTTQPITIEKYWTFQTRRNLMSSAVKTYHVVDSVTIPAGETEAYVFVRAMVPGMQGNTSEGSVTELGDDFKKNGVMVDAYNEDAILGGKEGFVRVTGEYVFVPTEEDAYYLAEYDAKFSYDEVRYFYGDDLKVVDNDLQISSMNDLSTVNYIENVKQAVNRRFMTEKGDILSDFTFGNGVAEIIGDSKLPFEAKERLVRIEILDCLRYEDRVEEPEITRLEVVPHERACYVDLTMKVVKVGAEMSLTNVRIGGDE